MNWSDVSFAPPGRTLRQFAGIWTCFFGALALNQWLRHDAAGAGLALAALALTVGPLGLWRPQVVRPVYVGLMVLTFPVGWVVSRIILAVLFYGVFTPVGLLFRLMGRDALGLRRRPGKATYWVDKPAPADVGSYFRQF